MAALCAGGCGSDLGDSYSNAYLIELDTDELRDRVLRFFSTQRVGVRWSVEGNETVVQTEPMQRTSDRWESRRFRLVVIIEPRRSPGSAMISAVPRHERRGNWDGEDEWTKDLFATEDHPPIVEEFRKFARSLEEDYPVETEEDDDG